MDETLNPLELWRTWVESNWIWLLPIVVPIIGPVLASVMTIGYDWFKTKGLIR